MSRTHVASRNHLYAAVAVSLLLAGCGGDSFDSPGVDGHDASIDSPGAEVGTDTSAEDVREDAPIDAAQDQATDDAAQDAGQDSPDDATQDVAADVPEDASGDAPGDVIDAAQDAPGDAVPDAPEDSPDDAVPDSPDDVATDAPDDVAPDAACTEGDKRCNGNVLEQCESDALWHMHTYCPGLQHAGTSTCSAGACVLGCDLGWSDCNGTISDGCEVATGSDVQNCGTCGHACNGPACYSGTCAQDVTVVVPQGGHVLMALAQDSTHLYWMEDTSGMGIAWDLRRVPKAGGNAETLVVDASHGQGMDLVVTGGFAWWTEPYAGGVWKVAVAGGTPVVMVDPNLLGNTDRAKTDRILVDVARGRLTWFGKDNPKNLNSAPTAGGGVSLVASLPYQAVDYALDDGGGVYAVCDTGTNTRIYAINTTTGAFGEATGGWPIQGRPVALYARYSGQNLYFATTATTDHVQCAGGGVGLASTNCPDWGFTSTTKPLDVGFGRYRTFDVDQLSYFHTDTTMKSVERWSRGTSKPPRTEATGQDRVKELVHDDTGIYWINDHGLGSAGEIRKAPNLAP